MIRKTFAALLAFGLSTPAFADELQTIEVKGEAAITAGNVLGARDRATEDALRKAVEQCVGTMVVSTSLVEKSQLIHDSILTKAKGYVSKYEVLSQGELKGVAWVQVRAMVGQAALADDLASLGLTLARKGMPRLAVLISEQRIDEPKPAAWWGTTAGALKLDQRVVETTLTERWLKDGFTFVEPDALVKGIKTAKVTSTDLGANEVRELGKAVDQIDVVIVGSAVSIKTGDNAKLLEGISHNAAKDTSVSCSATLTARAFNADNAELLAAREETAVMSDLSPLSCGRGAMVAAAKKLSDGMKTDLITKWNQQLMQGNRVQVRFTGVDSIKMFGALKAGFAERIRGAKVSGTPRFDHGAADFDVLLVGSVDDAAAEVEAWKVGGKKVKVVSMSPNKIEAEISK